MNELFGRLSGFYLMEMLKGFMKDEKGQTLVEYALILVLIAIVVLLMLSGLGHQVNNTFNSVNSALKR
jgi:pilus assembly protein Flp/PilA